MLDGRDRDKIGQRKQFLKLTENKVSFESNLHMMQTSVDCILMTGRIKIKLPSSDSIGSRSKTIRAQGID